MHFLNPFDKVRRDGEIKAVEENKKGREGRLKNRRAARKTFRKHGRNFIANFNKELKGSQAKIEQEYKDYIKSTKIGKDAMKEQID